MRLVVLGCAAYGPFAGTPCPGYLVQSRGATVLVDCGPGVATALGTLAHPGQLSAIAISRLDPEYWLDLLPLGWTAHGRPLADDYPGTAPLPVWLPPAGVERLEAAAQGLLPEARHDVPPLGGEVLRLREYTGGETVEIRGLSLRTFQPPWHPSRGFTLRIEAEGAAIAFAGDLRPSEVLVEAARRAELIVCSVTPGTLDHGGGPSELADPVTAARQAGAIATASGVGTLLLSSLLSTTEQHVSALAEAARERFAGPIYVAEPGMRLFVYPRSPGLVDAD